MAKRKKRSTAALVGAGSLLDLAGSATYRAARRRQISGWDSDWNLVGRDLRRAMASHRRKLSATNQ